MADNKLQRLSPVALIISGIIGAALGFAVQLVLSAQGRPPLVPPYSMPITLAALAALLIVLGIRLRRNVLKGVGAVNPFQAVRLLATARAGQLVGALFLGFGVGLLLSLTNRSVPAPVSTWLPMAITAAAALALLVCAIITEHLCRVPPGEDGENGEEDPGLTTIEA